MFLLKTFPYVLGENTRENIIVTQHFSGFAGNNFRPGVSGRTCFHQGRRDPRKTRLESSTWGLGLPTTATSSLVSASCSSSPGWIPPHDRHHFTCSLAVTIVTAAIATVSQELGVFLLSLSVIKQNRLHSVGDRSTFGALDRLRYIRHFFSTWTRAVQQLLRVSMAITLFSVMVWILHCAKLTPEFFTHCSHNEEIHVKHTPPTHTRASTCSNTDF